MMIPKIMLVYAVFYGQVMADSMMLSPAELEAIGLATDEASLAKQAPLKETKGTKLRLDGIVFNGQDDWSIWLNGQRFSNGEHPDHYKIVKVGHNRVEILASDQEKAIILSLGQG